MIEFLIGALVSLASLYLGYIMGKNSSIIPEETRKQVKRLVRALPIDRGLGGVSRPTAHEIANYENPIKQAEEEEMSKTLSEIVK